MSTKRERDLAMADKQDSLGQLQTFLNKLFQFESQDLDFGVYKILHYKRAEIKEYIDTLLVDTVREQLSTLSESESEHIDEQLAELAEDGLVSAWIASKDKKQKEAFIAGDSAGRIKQYQKLTKQKKSVTVSKEVENQIYNHLTTFFSRYYDKGDFISKRRFGKNEKYMVPYNGEETHFYWANHDQYYIKSSETFQQYSFKLGNLPVRFKLTEAKVEQGNVKADENNFFMLSEDKPELGKKEIVIYFEYRPLTAEEKKEYTGNNKQESINDAAYELLKKKIGKDTNAAKLFEVSTDSETPVLLQKLRHYTRKNTYDFFIHKDLKGFLSRELDFYIKSELINVDDLYVSDAAEHFDALEHNFRTIKVFKNIADNIIEFISKIEEFQKKLWEKKKFVLGTEWVITLDRLVDYIGEDAAKPFIEQVIKNKQQVAEWHELFGKENLPEKLSLASLKRDSAYLKLPIDTVHFDKTFKEELLTVFSEEVDIEEVSDGLVIHSDNYHGLLNLQDKYKRQVQTIYIDPPYNTDASAIIYKNDYKGSSFASFIDSRSKIASNLLNNNGILCAAIDDEEILTVRNILSEHFIKQAGVAVVRSNPAGRKTKGKFAPAHEYALFYAGSDSTVPLSLEISEKRLKRYPKEDAKGRFAWANFIRSGNNDRREDRPKLYYPIYVSSKDEIRVPKLEWNADNEEFDVLENPKKDEVVVFPILVTESGKIEKNWQRGPKRVMSELDEFRIRRNGSEVSIDFKTRMDESSLPVTWWDDKKYASANYGAAELKALFGESPFDYPKAQKLVEDCIRVSGGINDKAIVIDFFPGSGTTFHAVQLLRKEEDKKQKTIIVEQGSYIYSIILPRIKKVAYTFDWKDGKPKGGSMDGLGVFVKYQRLEQYEEALENISFDVEAGQQAIGFSDYVPKYMLDFETKNSQTLVNIEAMQDPWNYKLKVWDGYTYDTEQAVDLVETFNYLIGLHVEKIVTKEMDKQKYQFVYGHTNDGKKSLVVWRSVKGWKTTDYTKDKKVLEDELKNYSYDTLYINDQASVKAEYQQIEDVFKHAMMN